MEKLALYIHIPFCESKCSYCNFVSFTNSKQNAERYIDALLHEIKLQGEKYKNCVVDTIFVGGGTPSCLKRGLLTKLFNCLYLHFNISKNAEITIEANPNSITQDFINEIEICKINRLSIGLQTSNDIILKQINRIHTRQDFLNAIKLVKKSNIKNINVDLLIGLPNQTMQDVKDSLDLLLNLDINHISCYGLIVEENTKIYADLKNNKISLPDEDLSNQMYNYVYEYLKQHNIFRYEVSNFAKLGCECRHNIKYWERENYLGLGLVSSSLINNVRFNNESNLQKYIEHYLNSEVINVNSIEILSKQDIAEELIMLGLRMTKGLNLNTFKQQVGYDLIECKNREINKLKNLNLIQIENDYLKLTNNGFFVLNQIILELI